MFSPLVLVAVLSAVDVTSLAEVRQQLGQQATVVGVIERVPLAKDKHGTAIVLDDDTLVYVTYGAPPKDWEVGTRVKVSGLLSPSLSEEQSLMAPHLRQPSAPKKEVQKPSALIGKRVRLTGVARNAKGGAVLLVERATVYVDGLAAWPQDAVGKKVSVGGQLVDKKSLVIEAPKWRVVTEK